MNKTAVFAVALYSSVSSVSAAVPGDFRLDQVAAKGHPRLFANAGRFGLLKQQAKGDRLRALAARRVVERAGLLAEEPVLERRMEGMRLLSVSRAALYRISTLAMAWNLTEDRRFLDRAVAELESVCAFSDWNPRHFLDVAEMSLAVSIGYDWLYGDLPEETRRMLRNALCEKALMPGLAGGWWSNAKNNWGQVCRAGLIAASLVLADDPALRGDCEKMLSGSLEALKISMSALAPDGCYPEGPGYWHYGVSYNVFAIAMLESACGTDFGLSALPGFWKTADYPNAVTGPTGLTIGYSDSGRARPVASILWWFARKLNRPELPTMAEVSEWNDSPKKGFAGWLPPLELFWMDDRKSGVSPMHLPPVWSPRSENPIVVLRAGEGAAFAGLKGGTPGANHGHMDGGNFVLDMDGVRWAWELAGENYQRIESLKTVTLWKMDQDSSRWSLFRLNADGHNVPQIDGAQQLVSGFAKIVETSAEPNPRAVMDLTSLYDGAATNVTRSFMLSADGTRFAVRDVFEGLRPGAEVSWKFITKAKAVPSGDKVVLCRDGRTLNVVKKTSCASAGEWTVSPAEGPNPPNSPNKGFSVVKFTMKADDDGRVRAIVAFSRPTGQRKSM